MPPIASILKPTGAWPQRQPRLTVVRNKKIMPPMASDDYTAWSCCKGSKSSWVVVKIRELCMAHCTVDVRRYKLLGFQSVFYR